MRRKLSPKIVEHLKAPGPKRMDAWDTVLQCFGVRVSPSGRRTWFLIVRVDGRQKRVSIGTYPAISLAEARAKARKNGQNTSQVFPLMKANARLMPTAWYATKVR